MRIVSPKANLIKKDSFSPYQFIEKIGRTCYKSEDKITESSAKDFVVNTLAARKHYAMLEHLYLHIKLSCKEDSMWDLWCNAEKGYRTSNNRGFNPFQYLQVSPHRTGKDIYITGSLRTFINLQNTYVFEDMWSFVGVNDYIVHILLEAVREIVPELITCDSFDSFEYKNLNTISYHIYSSDKEFTDEIYHKFADKADSVVAQHIFHTVHFICDRGVSHEIVRHRPCSFAQESTRYCNYSLGKFDNEITFIKPCFYNEGTMQYDLWEKSCSLSETYYMALIEGGSKPQEARDVLPNSLKTEIIVTANEVEWQHIINLRVHGTTGAPHPQMVEVMTMAYDQLKDDSDFRLC